MQTDAELLRQYVEDGSEAAFRELVRRHLGLVYSAAVRHAGGSKTLAEDVAQSVFIILARQGPSLTSHETLVGWLHICTRFTTLRALRDARRRQHRERKAVAMGINESTSVCWDQVRPLLDEAVAKLNGADRQAVLLRFFQGRSHREVGSALGVTEDAARVRVDRALEKLRGQFARRGIFTTGALLGETILAHAAEVEPAGLAGRVNAASAAGTANAAWVAVILRLIFMSTKKKIAIAAALILLAGLFTVVWPKWAGSSAPEKARSQNSANKIAVRLSTGKSAVAAPRLAEAPVSSPEAVAVASAPSSSAVFGQIVAAITLPPPPAAPAAPGGSGGSGGRGANRAQNIYAGLSLKLNLTQEQLDEYMKIMAASRERVVAVNQDARSRFTEDQIIEMTNIAGKQMIPNDPATLDPTAFVDAMNEKINDQLGITAQLQAIKDDTNAQLQLLLGSKDKFQTYQTFMSQSGVRQWVIGSYGRALQTAGAPELTTNQQEALVEIVAKSLQPGDWFGGFSQLPQVVDQASTILTPEQIEVLKTNPKGNGLSYYQLHRAP